VTVVVIVVGNSSVDSGTADGSSVWVLRADDEDGSKMEDKMGAFEAPAPQKTTVRVHSFSTGKVNVMRWGGGLGESSMPATNNFCSSNKG
jgi:hypothetical protein